MPDDGRWSAAYGTGQEVGTGEQIGDRPDGEPRCDDFEHAGSRTRKAKRGVVALGVYGRNVALSWQGTCTRRVPTAAPSGRIKASLAAIGRAGTPSEGRVEAGELFGGHHPLSA